MRTAILSISFLVVTAAPAQAAEASQRLTSIPAQFRGEWNMVRKDCGTARNDSRLRIAAKEVRHFESRGKVLAVAVRGKRELALITENTGEGETWLATGHYRLSADRKELVDASAAPPLVRYRCP